MNDKNRRLVLIVDDQEINRDLLGMILEEHYELLFANDGAEAMDLIRAHRDLLSLILLDLMMPVMDGFEVLEAVHNDETLRHIPIIVLTAEKSAELRALQMGAADFITKPFDLYEVILARAARIIELNESRSVIRTAERDELTGLYTPNFFFPYCSRILRYHPEWEMDAVAINIERFHLINELYGRENGDSVLREIGDHVGAWAAGRGGIACRSEAATFYVFLRRGEDYEAWLSSLEEQLTGQFGSIRVRMGLCFCTDSGMDPTDLFDRAKTACNLLRGSYTHRVMAYDLKMHEKEAYSQSLVDGLPRALADHEFQVFFQPKYAIQGDRPVLSSAEALVRWQHPEYGMVSPGAFIPLFESNGLIQQVDEYVWAEAARQIAEWRDKYGVTIPVSVNLSRVDLHDPKLNDKLLDLISKNGLRIENLKLEITESAYTDDPKKLIDRVQGLQELGFEIEMDDFGTGYSSLNMISNLPIDVLKLDMMFIRNVKSRDDKSFRLVQIIMGIADFLQVPTVAEGVETAEQCHLLRDVGCELIQGYYFSRPLPANEFEQLIVKELHARNAE